MGPIASSSDGRGRVPADFQRPGSESAACSKSLNAPMTRHYRYQPERFEPPARLPSRPAPNSPNTSAASKAAEATAQRLATAPKRLPETDKSSNVPPSRSNPPAPSQTATRPRSTSAAQSQNLP